jgi:hypothetical protein
VASLTFDFDISVASQTFGSEISVALWAFGFKAVRDRRLHNVEIVNKMIT